MAVCLLAECRRTKTGASQTLASQPCQYGELQASERLWPKEYGGEMIKEDIPASTSGLHKCTAPYTEDGA